MDDAAIRDAVERVGIAGSQKALASYRTNQQKVAEYNLAKKELLDLIAAQCAAPNLFNGWDAEHWGLNYEELRDACDKFLPPDLLHDGEEAEAWLYEQSIRRAGEEITRLRAEAARLRRTPLHDSSTGEWVRE